MYVWSDPNQDGSPVDAVLVCETSAAAEAGSIETDVPQVVPLDPACGSVDFAAGEGFFIGASAAHAAGFFPAPMDQSEPLAHLSWVHFNDPVFDPTNMGGALNMDCVDPPDCTVSFPADWMLRANF